MFFVDCIKNREKINHRCSVSTSPFICQAPDTYSQAILFSMILSVKMGENETEICLELTEEEEIYKPFTNTKTTVVYCKRLLLTLILQATHKNKTFFLEFKDSLLIMKGKASSC